MPSAKGDPAQLPAVPWGIISIKVSSISLFTTQATPGYCCLGYVSMWACLRTPVAHSWLSPPPCVACDWSVGLAGGLLQPGDIYLAPWDVTPVGYPWSLFAPTWVDWDSHDKPVAADG